MSGLIRFCWGVWLTDEWKAPAKASADDGDAKSWKLLEKTLLASVQEQRRSRRWGIFFKLLTFVYLFGALALFSPLMDMEKAATRSGNYTALIDVTGVIADKEPASADNIVGSLRAAFEDEKVKGVILRINSPGGSPVQSGYVYDEIRRLRGLHPEIKLYAVISDLGASGAYYIASAADQIYADKASLVGSEMCIRDRQGVCQCRQYCRRLAGGFRRLEGQGRGAAD